MMKWVFLLCLLLIGGIGAVLGGAVGYRWMHNMFYTQRVMPGEYNFSMPTGSLPRNGGQLYHSPAEREAAAARRNPVARHPGLGAPGRGAVRHLLHAVPRGVGDAGTAWCRPSSCRPPTSPIPICRRCGRTATGRAISPRGAR